MPDATPLWTSDEAEKATGDQLHAQTLGLFRRAMRWIG